MLKIELQADQWDSPGALETHRVAWDDLWQRTDGCRPAELAEATAAWLRHFAAKHAVRIPYVRGPGDRLHAAIVLHAPRRGAARRPARLTANPWNPGIGLLWDRSAPTAETADRLATQIRNCGFPLIRLLDVPVEDRPWPALLDALAGAGLHLVVTPSRDNLAIDLTAGFDAVRGRMSQGLRKTLRRGRRKLADRGDLAVRVESPGDAAAALSLLEQALAIEHAGWKGAAGTSVRSVPEAHAYFRDLAVIAADAGTLRVSFLELAGRAIACEIGTIARGVYHSTKVAYDEAYAAESPGHLLMEALLERFAGAGLRRFDCLSPPTPALLRWGPRHQRRARVLIAPPGPMGRLITGGFRFAHAAKRRLASAKG